MEVITSHINPDFDMIASMMAAKKLYPKARLVLPGALEKWMRDSLDRIAFPFKLERVKDIDLGEIKRLILVDIRHCNRIGSFVDIIDRHDIDIHIYDHHPSTPDDIQGSYEAICPYGATTTILTLIIKKKVLDLTEDEATILMLGIYEDTGSLSYLSTTEKDYEAAAFLLSKGADLGKVSSLLKRELTPEELHVLDDLIQSSMNYNISGIDVMVAETPADNYKGQVSVLAHKLMDIEAVESLFILVGMKDRVHLVARSRAKEVNVGAVASRLGGGGHPTAASATMKGLTPIQAKERLIEALRKQITPKRITRDIMSAPAKTVTAGTTLESVGQMFTRYNINAVPVVDEDTERCVGVITRQVVDKAIYHGLGKIRVDEYMTTDIESVTSYTFTEEMRDRLIGHGYRLLPVIEDEKVIGVITRTDMLRLYHEEITETPFGSCEFGRGHKKNVAGTMKKRLPVRILDLLQEAGEVANKHGYKLYIVGGFVRDMILGYKNLDIDLVVEGDGLTFAKELARSKECKVRTHDRFGTAVIVFNDGFKVDVATARQEYYERPGSLPTVELSSLKLDLYRRDFTINTLAIDLAPDRFGEMLDFFGGQRDIKERNIRVLQNLSFIEDPTRVFRAVRFAERYGFRITNHTLKLIKSAVKIDAFRHIRGKRILEELMLTLKEDKAVDSLKTLKQLDLLRFIHPRLSLDKKGLTVIEKAKDAISWYGLSFKERTMESWKVFLLALFDPLRGDELIELAESMSIDGKLFKLLVKDKPEGVQAIDRISRMEESINSEIYRLLRPIPLEVLLYLIAKAESMKVRKAITRYISELSEVEIFLDGSDLKKMGIPEAPVYGKILKSLLSKKLDGKIKTKEEEMAAVQDILKGNFSLKTSSTLNEET